MFFLAKNDCEANSFKEEENWDTDDTTIYHTLNLPRESIHIINDSNSFQHFLDNGLLNISIVGIDSEWKPSFSKNKKNLPSNCVTHMLKKHFFF